ncbi:MAG: hypothetical protein HKN05_07590 [Rhizobiales bacterium]|nr:hypothetical protein [Hyphomicrobiales bacterium]
MRDYTQCNDLLDFNLHDGVESTLDFALEQIDVGLAFKFGLNGSVTLAGISFGEIISGDFIFLGLVASSEAILQSKVTDPQESASDEVENL